MIASCDWSDPGRDAYTGTPRAAIMAMAEIPRPVRLALVARAEAHDYDDTVYIDRDSIRSPKHAYDPAIRAMAFGSNGRVCKTVTRTGWAASRVEGAWVYCDSGWCVAMPAVCRNWFIASRVAVDLPAHLAGSGGPVVDVADEPSAAVLIADPQMPSGPSGVPVGQPALADGSVGSAFNTFTDAGYAYGSAAIPGLPCHVAAVAEPSSYALILAGLAAVALVKRRKA